jgi:hypothetical protein
MVARIIPQCGMAFAKLESKKKVPANEKAAVTPVKMNLIRKRR